MKLADDLNADKMALEQIAMENEAWIQSSMQKVGESAMKD